MVGAHESDPADNVGQSEDAYDAFLDAALRGERAAEEEYAGQIADGGVAAEEIRSAILGLGRVLRGEPEPEATARLRASGDLPFERLGEYRLIRVLGRGGMGVVYLAEQSSLGRLVALKVLRPDQLGSQAEVRFRREMHAVAQLRHPNIVTVHGSGEDRGVTFMVMELILGRGLDEILDESRDQGRPLPAASVVRWGRQVASALAVAHAERFLHRDVKPSNIRIDPDDRAVLLDFGLAKKLDGRTFTTTGAMTGSPYYASPEQISGHSREISELSDVYSLGVTLYECATGRVPFDSEDPAGLLHQILSAEPPAPRRLRPDLSRDLETVIQCAMDRNPKRRYQSATDLAADLESVGAFRVIRARPAGPLARAAKWVRRNRTTSLALSVVILVLLVLLAARIISAMAETREFQGLLWSASQYAQAEKYEQAVAAVDRARGLRRGDAEALQLRAEILRQRERQQAQKALEQARGQLARFREHSLRRVVARRTVDTLTHQQSLRWLLADERARLVVARRELERFDLGFEESRFRLEQSINSAAALFDPKRGQDLKAGLYLDLWRLADELDDARSKRLYAQIVAENDPNGRHTASLSSPGLLDLSSEPPGAGVHLFRYERHSDLVEGGDQRLIPVPLDHQPRAIPVPPGAVVLRVVEDREELLRGDLILSVRGRPVTTNFLEADGELLQEYLVSIGGRPVGDAEALRYETFERIIGEGVRRATQLTPREHLFDRNGESLVRTIRNCHEIGYRILNASEAIRHHGPLPAVLFRDGESTEVSLPRGLPTRFTAAALFKSPRTEAGSTPLPELRLEAGSYLALLWTAGREEIRVPFTIERGQTTSISVELPPAGLRPEGLTFVARGTFRAGGDNQAPFAEEASEPLVDGFWIGETEVTTEQYARFLNHPSTVEILDREGDAFLVPSLALPIDVSQVWKRDEQGRFLAPLSRREMPVSSVSWDAARAYVNWLNEQGFAPREDLVFDLPTEWQWEKAGRGVDGRSYAYGTDFNPRWARSRYSRVVPVSEIVNAYPVDESPYGVFDLTGNLFEWCADVFSEGRQNLRLIKGGSWGMAVPNDFRLAMRIGEPPGQQRTQGGFRIVLRGR